MTFFFCLTSDTRLNTPLQHSSIKLLFYIIYFRNRTLRFCRLSPLHPVPLTTRFYRFLVYTINTRVARLWVDSRRLWSFYTLPSTTQEPYMHLNRFKNNLWHSSGRNSKFFFRLSTRRRRTRTGRTFQKLNGFCEHLFKLYTLIVPGQCGAGGTQDRWFFETRRRQNGRHDGRVKRLRIGHIRLWNRRRPYERVIFIVVFVAITMAGRDDLGRRRSTAGLRMCVYDGNEQCLDCVWPFSAGVVENPKGNEKQIMSSTFGLSPHWRVPCE